jgi:hypothetical protein
LSILAFIPTFTRCPASSIYIAGRNHTSQAHDEMTTVNVQLGSEVNSVRSFLAQDKGAAAVYVLAQ